jgi:hypothetical protein
MSKPTVAFINDTSINLPHFGCQLVCQTFREQFARTGLELKVTLGRNFNPDDHAEALSSVDLLVINGEGSLHHDRHRHLIDLAERYPAVLMNCVYQDNSPHPGLSKFLYISARESASAAAITEAGGHAVVVPDALFASSFLRSFQKPAPTDELGETDNVVRQYFHLGPLKIRRKIGFSTRCPTVAGYLEKLCSYRRLCIGRFHAAIAASVLEIPFSTWDSNTWKTRALMSDMGVPHLHFSNRTAALAAVPGEFPVEIRKFASEAPARIEAAFDRIARIAHELYQDACC